ncbi:MAG: hypothetical protein LBL79_09670 [Prevotella sp.]|jgi:hypothetical protein|nr:hypothetical protein [Prevotella sp.]
MRAEDILDFISNPTNKKEPVRLSNEDIDREKKLIELGISKEFLKSSTQDREERKNYAYKVYWLILGFLAITLGIVIASGIERLCFYLSDSVLIVLLTTTSANVIGIFMAVVRYLFKQKP